LVTWSSNNNSITTAELVLEYPDTLITSGTEFITDFIYEYDIKPKSYPPNKFNYSDIIYNNK